MRSGTLRRRRTLRARAAISSTVSDLTRGRTRCLSEARFHLGGCVQALLIEELIEVSAVSDATLRM
jgi:hypothetical protein